VPALMALLVEIPPALLLIVTALPLMLLLSCSAPALLSVTLELEVNPLTWMVLLLLSLILISPDVVVADRLPVVT